MNNYFKVINCHAQWPEAVSNDSNTPSCNSLLLHLPSAAWSDENIDTKIIHVELVKGEKLGMWVKNYSEQKKKRQSEAHLKTKSQIESLAIPIF